MHFHQPEIAHKAFHSVYFFFLFTGSVISGVFLSWVDRMLHQNDCHGIPIRLESRKRGTKDVIKKKIGTIREKDKWRGRWRDVWRGRWGATEGERASAEERGEDLRDGGRAEGQPSQR